MRTESTPAGPLSAHNRAVFGAIVAALLALACGTSSEVPDAAVDGPSCARTCDDGVYCNGLERCAPGEVGADGDGCLASDPPCEGRCDEVERSCGACDDADADGANDAACGGTDCDDTAALVFPGATEICDAAGTDEDCDPTTYGVRDADGDGFADGTCCNGETCGPDCDDASATVHPSSAETCDGRDNDCDDGTDEGVVPTFYEDADGDGYGSSSEGAATLMQCLSPGSGWAASNDDCDDALDDVHPGLPDICNRRDDNCRDGVAEEEGCPCFITDPPIDCGTDVGECVHGTMRCIAGEWGPCEGAVLSATEVCTPSSVGTAGALDEDCDGSSDEGLTASPCHRDRDGDGYGDRAVSPVVACASGGSCPPGYAPEGGDCNDEATGGDVHPGAVETCNIGDDDCDGRSDETARVSRTYVPPTTCAVPEWNRNNSCDGRVAQACAAIPVGPGGCTHSTGFATYIGGAVDAVCLVGVLGFSVTLADLAAAHAGCDGTPTGYPACRAAANRICIGRSGGGVTYVGGYPVRATVGGWQVHCFQDFQAEVRSASWAELDARDGAPEAYCGGFPADGWWCNRAADRFCRDAGFEAGFGPVEQTATATSLLCIRDF
jgi:hypothetical protein